MCRKEVQEEQKALQKSTEQIHVCRQGPFPSLADDECMPEFDPETFQFTSNGDLNDDPEDQMAEGNRLLSTSVLPLAEEIQASQTTLQRLSEAHQKTVGTETEIPEHLRDFNDVFSKESFDALPNRKV